MKKLDYGCGSGGFEEIDYRTGKVGSWLVANAGPDTFGIDINPLRIDVARQKITGAQLLVMDGRRLDFPDNYFDMIHEFGVFHHMPAYEQGIAEISRVLKPGGVFLLTESVDNDLAFRFARRIFGKWHEDDVSTYFDTHKLNRSLSKYFVIAWWEYHWRFLPSDFLRQYNLEPWISVMANEWMSKIFNAVGLGDRTCCHYVVKTRKL